MEHVITLSKLTPIQQQVFDDLEKYSTLVILAGRQSGKSHLCRDIVIEYLLSGKRCLYLTPEYKLGTAFLEIIENILGPICKVNRKDYIITIPGTNGRVAFYTDKTAESVRGITNIDLIVIDEASFFTNLREKLNSALLPTQTVAKDPKLLLVSTPFGYNDFASYFNNGLEGLHNSKSYKFTYRDNPYVNLKFIEERKAEMPERLFNQEFEANIIDMDCIFGDVESCVIRELSKKPPVVFGIDVASLQDYAVIIGLDEDMNMCYFDRFQGPLKLIVDKALNLPRGIPIKIDKSGNGLGVFQDLITQRTSSNGSQIYGFQFTAESKPQLIYSLMDSIDKKEIGINQITAEELKTMEMSTTPNGHFKYSAKSGFYDDCVMSLALAIDCYKKVYTKTERIYRRK